MFSFPVPLQELYSPVTQLGELLVSSATKLAFSNNENLDEILYGSYAATWNLIAQVSRASWVTCRPWACPGFRSKDWWVTVVRGGGWTPVPASFPHIHTRTQSVDSCST